MSALTPEARSRRARIAALTRWSREDPAPATAKARTGFLQRFEHEVDPDGVLTPDERATRAQRALRAHMLRLSAKSAAARRKTDERERGDAA
jgi:hypothetical protein